MSCDNNKNRKAQNKDVVDKAKASLDEATAALAEATKQEKDTEKKHADAEAGFIMFIVSSAASGLVSKCRIPTAAVAQYGLFRILLGDTVSVSNVSDKDETDMQPEWWASNFYGDGKMNNYNMRAGDLYDPPTQTVTFARNSTSNTRLQGNPVW